MAATDTVQPPEHGPWHGFATAVARACNRGDEPDRPNRAKLRRALGATDPAECLEALRVIGHAINDTDTLDLVSLKLGVAGLYAKHAGNGTGKPWYSMGNALRRISREQRGGRELMILLRARDAATAIRAADRALSISPPPHGHNLGWGLLLADMNALTSGNDARRRAVANRWGRDFACQPPEQDGKSDQATQEAPAHADSTTTESD